MSRVCALLFDNWHGTWPRLPALGPFIFIANAWKPNRSTYEADCKTTETAKLATLQTATNTEQETINAVGVNAGKPPALGYSVADADYQERRRDLSNDGTKSRTRQAAKNIELNLQA